MYHLPMTEELMVGTVGWNHGDWVGGYYPDDMPDEWRFGYYSNDFRAVLVPGDHFTDAQLSVVDDWLEDCDESFRFVVEIPTDLLPESACDRLTEFLDRLAGLGGREPILHRQKQPEAVYRSPAAKQTGLGLRNRPEKRSG